MLVMIDLLVRCEVAFVPVSATQGLGHPLQSEVLFFLEQKVCILQTELLAAIQGTVTVAFEPTEETWSQSHKRTEIWSNFASMRELV